MLVTITRGPVALTIDAPANPEDASRALLDRLEHALRRRGVRLTRQLAQRLYAYPDGPGEVARLAEACRVWLVRQGCEVVVGDW